MSSKAQKSKKTVKEVEAKISDTEVEAKISDNEINEVNEVKPKKKASKKKPQPEVNELVSDSESSFIKTIVDTEKVAQIVDVEGQDSDIDIEKKSAKVSNRKKTHPVNLKINQVINTDFSTLTQEDIIILSDKINMLNKKLTAHLCGTELKPEELNTKDNQKGKKGKKEKKPVPLDEEGNPIKKDTSNHPLNIKKEVYEQVLDFLEQPKGTLVSNKEVQAELRKVRLQTDGNVNGKLKTLLEYIIPNRKQIDDSISDNIPSTINNTTDIITYAAYCFPKSVKAPKKAKVDS